MWGTFPTCLQDRHVGNVPHIETILGAGMTPAIHCRDLRKQYPARPAPVDAVNGLDLEVAVGECFGLLGPNGG